MLDDEAFELKRAATVHKVYEPYIRARLGSAAHFCEVVVPEPLRAGRQEAERLTGLLPQCQANGSNVCRVLRACGPGFHASQSRLLQYRGTSLIRICPPRRTTLGP